MNQIKKLIISIFFLPLAVPTTPIYTMHNNSLDTVKIITMNSSSIKRMITQSPTMLITAATENNGAVARILLENEANPNVQNKKGESPLTQATRKGHTGMVRLLLQHNANANITNQYNITPLLIAAINSHAEIIPILLRHDAHIEIRDEEGSTPLLIAAREGHAEVARVLLEHGAVVNVLNNEKETPLVAAVSQKHHEVTQALLELGADVNIADGNGDTPLIIAITKNCPITVHSLLRHGANTSLVNAEHNTPLIIAASTGLFPIVKMLIAADNQQTRAHNTHINAQNSQGNTALLAIIEHQNQTPENLNTLNIIKALLDNGAALDIANKEGYTPLVLAAHKGHEKTVNLLLKHHRRPDMRDSEIQHSGLEKTVDTALLMASYTGHTATIQILLDHKADANSQACDNITSLQCACACASESSVALLLTHKAVVNHQDLNGQTALLIAALGSHEHFYASSQYNAIIEKLIRNGANPRIPNNEGLRPIDIQNASVKEVIINAECEKASHDLAQQDWEQKDLLTRDKKTNLTRVEEATSLTTVVANLVCEYANPQYAPEEPEITDRIKECIEQNRARTQRIHNAHAQAAGMCCAAVPDCNCADALPHNNTHAHSAATDTTEQMSRESSEENYQQAATRKKNCKPCIIA